MGSGGNIRWVYRYEAEVDLYKSIPSCKQEDSELWYYYIALSVLLNESKIFLCRIGVMMEEGPETGPTYRCTL